MISVSGLEWSYTLLLITLPETKNRSLPIGVVGFVSRGFWTLTSPPWVQESMYFRGGQKVAPRKGDGELHLRPDQQSAVIGVVDLPDYEDCFTLMKHVPQKDHALYINLVHSGTLFIFFVERSYYS